MATRDGDTTYAAAPILRDGARVPQRALTAVDHAGADFGAAGRWFAVAGVVTVLLGVLVALRLARSLSRPLVAAEAATRRIAEGDLAARVPEPRRGDDELGRLVTSINEMAASLERAQRTERDFLLSVSHDLRTPLTSVSGWAEALADGTAPDTGRGRAHDPGGGAPPRPSRPRPARPRPAAGARVHAPPRSRRPARRRDRDGRGPAPRFRGQRPRARGGRPRHTGRRHRRPRSPRADRRQPARERGPACCSRDPGRGRVRRRRRRARGDRRRRRHPSGSAPRRCSNASTPTSGRRPAPGRARVSASRSCASSPGRWGATSTRSRLTAAAPGCSCAYPWPRPAASARAAAPRRSGGTARSAAGGTGAGRGGPSAASRRGSAPRRAAIGVTRSVYENASAAA